MQTENRNFRNLRTLTIPIVTFLIITTLLSVFLFPESLGTYGITSFLLTIILLLFYFSFCFKIPDIASKPNFETGIQKGTIMGYITGLIWIIHLTIEHFVDIPNNLNAIVTLSFIGLNFCLFGFTAYRSMKKTGDITASLLSAVWCAMLGILILFLYAFILNYFFTAQLEKNLYSAFKESGMHDIRSFTIKNTLESAWTHLLEAPIIALIFGSLGILILIFKNKSHSQKKISNK